MPINWFRAELGLTVFNVWEENGERVGFTTIFFFFPCGVTDSSRESTFEEPGA